MRIRQLSSQTYSMSSSRIRPSETYHGLISASMSITSSGSVSSLFFSIRGRLSFDCFTSCGGSGSRSAAVSASLSRAQIRRRSGSKGARLRAGPKTLWRVAGGSRHARKRKQRNRCHYRWYRWRVPGCCVWLKGRGKNS
jgi:hypothetical protein